MRSIFRPRGLVCAAAIAALVVAAGCDSHYDPPTAPRAQLTARGALEFSCGLHCSYEGEAVNEGMGCAINVRGVTRLLSPSGAELERDSWFLPPVRRIQPGEPFLYEGCCFSAASKISMGSYRTEIDWDRVTCDF